MPLGQVPVLEINGKKLSQTVSICRFLAKKVGLAGATHMEDFEIDCVVDTINDFKLSKMKFYCYRQTFNSLNLFAPSRNFGGSV